MEVKKIISGNCYFCLAKTDYVWCKNCEKDFIQETSRCLICAQLSTHEVCGSCIKRPPHFNKTNVLFNYQYPASHLIKTLKFKNRPEFARCLSEKLALKLVSSYASLPDVIVPVPLHKTRQRSRGYNQSLEIAKQLSKRTGLKTDTGLCQKIKNTDPQSTLPIKQRKEKH